MPRVGGFRFPSYFLGICLGQLAYGTRPGPLRGGSGPLLWGMATLVVALAGLRPWRPNIEVLIVWRFIQAVAGVRGHGGQPGPGSWTSFPWRPARIFSSLMLVMGVAPILAPSLGGWMGIHFGWRSIFHFHTLLALGLALASWRILPGDRRDDTSFSLHPWKVLAGYGALFRERTFLSYSMAGNWGLAGLLAYIAGSPFVYMKLFGLSEAQYAWVFGLNSAALILGSQINIPLVKRISAERITRVSLVVQFLLALLLALAGGWFGLPPLPCMGLVALYLLTQGIVAPNASALSLQPFRQQAGSAAALSGALQMAFSALASALVVGFHDGTLRPMAIAMSGCTAVGVLFLLVAPKRP